MHACGQRTGVDSARVWTVHACTTRTITRGCTRRLRACDDCVRRVDMHGHRGLQSYRTHVRHADGLSPNGVNDREDGRVTCRLGPPFRGVARDLGLFPVARAANEDGGNPTSCGVIGMDDSQSFLEDGQVSD